MEETLAKLRAHTKSINDIMLLAQSSFKIVDYLTRDRPLLECEIIQHNHFLKFTIHANWRLYVTEMAKLFSKGKGDYYNLHQFITKFRPGNEFHKVSQIDERSLLIWEQNLTLEKNNIDNLLLQRDKQFSHSDKNRAEVKNTLSYAQAEELLSVVKRIVSEVYVAVFGQDILFLPAGEPVEDLKKVMTELVERKREDIIIYQQLAKQEGIDPGTLGLPEIE